MASGSRLSHFPCVYVLPPFGKMFLSRLSLKLSELGCFEQEKVLVRRNPTAHSFWTGSSLTFWKTFLSTPALAWGNGREELPPRLLDLEVVEEVDDERDAL